MENVGTYFEVRTVMLNLFASLQHFFSGYKLNRFKKLIVGN